MEKQSTFKTKNPADVRTPAGFGIFWWEWMSRRWTSVVWFYVWYGSL
jgi:hypothetical protein